MFYAVQFRKGVQMFYGVQIRDPCRTGPSVYGVQIQEDTTNNTKQTVNRNSSVSFSLFYQFVTKLFQSLVIPDSRNILQNMCELQRRYITQFLHDNTTNYVLLCQIKFFPVLGDTTQPLSCWPQFSIDFCKSYTK